MYHLISFYISVSTAKVGIRPGRPRNTSNSLPTNSLPESTCLATNNSLPIKLSTFHLVALVFFNQLLTSCFISVSLSGVTDMVKCIESNITPKQSISCLGDTSLLCFSTKPKSSRTTPRYLKACQALSSLSAPIKSSI